MKHTNSNIGQNWSDPTNDLTRSTKQKKSYWHMSVDPNQSNLHRVQKSLVDAQLLKQIGKQDMLAYEALYDRYASQVYGVIVRIVRNNAIADELLQETFWQIWQSAPKYEEQGTATGWIFRIARNRSMDELRRQKARPKLDETTEPVDAAVGAGLNQSSAETEAELHIDQEKVQRAISQIPIDQQDCLMLAYFEGLTHKEIAAQLELPIGTVKSRMRIGLEKLERLLRAEGYP